MSIVLARLGAQILTFPSAFTFATGASHWETILKARAVETQCYVVAAAQVGSHNDKRTSWGHSMVVSTIKLHDESCFFFLSFLTTFTRLIHGVK